MDRGPLCWTVEAPTDFGGLGMTQQFGHGFESLEERTLLAANVTAVLSNGTLTITGTSDADDIYVFGDGDAGYVEVTANGSADGAYGTFNGVKNIVVNTLGGDDDVNIDIGFGDRAEDGVGHVVGEL